MKSKKYRHLRQNDRDRIELLLRQGFSQKDIANVLGVNKSTVSREVTKRSRKNGRYHSYSAQFKANLKRSNSKYQGKKIEEHKELKEFIVLNLENKRSPDEIAGRSKEEDICPRVGKDAIYKWLYSVWGQKYCKYLCTKRYRPKKHKEKSKKEMIPDRVSLDIRPKTGNHAEADTFLSPKKSRSKTAVAVVSEIESKLFLGVKISNLKPKSMTWGMNMILAKMNVDSTALDNGQENRDHKNFLVPAFFCDPYSPWQKPHVEGNIGLLRRWFLPKGTDLASVSQEELDTYFNVLNNKWRKSLKYKSAIEVAREKGVLKKDVKLLELKENTSQKVALQPRI